MIDHSTENGIITSLTQRLPGNIDFTLSSVDKKANLNLMIPNTEVYMIERIDVDKYCIYLRYTADGYSYYDSVIFTPMTMTLMECVKTIIDTQKKFEICYSKIKEIYDKLSLISENPPLSQKWISTAVSSDGGMSTVDYVYERIARQYIDEAFLTMIVRNEKSIKFVLDSSDKIDTSISEWPFHIKVFKNKNMIIDAKFMKQELSLRSFIALSYIYDNGTLIKNLISDMRNRISGKFNEPKKLSNRSTVGS